VLPLGEAAVVGAVSRSWRSGGSTVTRTLNPMMTGVTGWFTGWKTYVAVMGRMGIFPEVAQAIGILLEMMDGPGGTSVQRTGTGRDTSPVLTTGIVTRNGAAEAPGQTATGMADTTVRQTLEEERTTGTGLAETVDITIEINGVGGIKTDTAGATITEAGKQPAPVCRPRDAMGSLFFAPRSISCKRLLGMTRP